MTANVHQLCNLVHFEHLFGPLWVYSCFGFANMDGCLPDGIVVWVIELIRDQTGKQLKREIPVKQTGVYYKSKPKPWLTLLVFKHN